MAVTDAEASTLGAILEGIFYGVYVALFTLYLILRGRNSRGINGPLSLAQISLFTLCTLYICLDTAGYYFQLVEENDDAGTKMDLATSVVFSLIDYLAQMILLYRCWIIWEKRWVVVIVPGFLALVSLGAEFALVGLINAIIMGGNADELNPRVFPTGISAFSISLGVNALTTSLIVSKIALISREVRPVLGPESHRPLRVAVAMLIESGLLVFVSQLIYLVLFSIGHPSFSLVAGPITQIYGITPTLLNIRVVMGAAYDKTAGKISALQFANSESERAATQTTGTSATTSGIHTRHINIGLDDVSDGGRACEKSV